MATQRFFDFLRDEEHRALTEGTCVPKFGAMFMQWFGLKGSFPPRADDAVHLQEYADEWDAKFFERWPDRATPSALKSRRVERTTTVSLATFPRVIPTTPPLTREDTFTDTFSEPDETV
jgi:hypothetical protein